MKYKLLKEEFLKDINCHGTVYEHIKSGARVVCLKNDDPNKMFAVGFKTPPIDSTGLTHILEHSVLCGSKKFKVKDPFVELLKTSLNTFLNAFTFPEKTMYPVASLNEKDFKNLMEVYMDSVFYPAIYEHEEIFLQEGWHYEINSKDEPITLNGVVYNEMKGAFSSADQTLSREVKKSLFPDNAYGFESGGDPRFIPDLTYESFKKFHSTYYHPSNSYIYMCGDINFEERLQWLDSEYLSKFDKIEVNTTIELQKPFDEPKYITKEYPVGEEDSLDNKAYLSYNVVLSNILNVKECLAFDVLSTVLFDNNSAPVKLALLKAQIADDIYASYNDLYQPYIGITAKNANPDNEQKFIDIIDSTLREVVKNGVNKEDIISQMNFNEFKMREANYQGMPSGIIFGINSLNSYLYDDSKPFEYLDSLKYYDELKKDLENGYFEQLIEKYFLNNNHKTYVKLVPSKEIQAKNQALLELKLDEYKKSLSDEEILALIEKNKALKVYQATPSTKEELDTLPKLSKDDISKEPRRYTINKDKINDIDLYHSVYFTNEICYVNMLFDIKNFSIEELQYAKILAKLFCELDTTNYSYAQIDRLIKQKTGGINTYLSIKTDSSGNDLMHFNIELSALKDNLPFALSLVDDQIKNISYDDKEHIGDLLRQIKSMLQAAVAQAGHEFALQRALATKNYAAYVENQISGYGFVQFLNDLVNKYNSNPDSVIEKLKAVSKKIFGCNNLILQTTCKDEYDFVKEQLVQFTEGLNVLEISSERPNVALPEGNFALKTPFDVNYVAVANTFDPKLYTGAYRVVSNILSMEYLWMQIRVKGGAYGAFFRMAEEGNVIFVSYRDPNIKSTYEAYENASAFLESMNPTNEEMEQYIIGAFGGVDDAPHASTLGKRAFLAMLTGQTFEKRMKSRTEALNCTVNDIKSFAKIIREVVTKGTKATVGNANAIEDNKQYFDEIKNI